MADQIRWGILSTANIGEKRVIPAIHKSKNGVVAAVASRSLERAQQFASQNDIPQAFGSYEELLAADIDALYIPLPNNQHAEWSIKAAEAGVPTLCEKPLAIDADEAQRMVDAFAERDVLFAEAFMYRFHPQTRRVKELVDSGGIGEIHTMNSTFTFTVSDSENIRLQKDLAGGALMDVGCYCVNAMRLMTGEEPVSAQAIARFGNKTGVDETISGILQFPSGAIGHFDASLRTYRTHMYELRGTEGRILVEESFVPDLTPETVTQVHYWHGAHYENLHINSDDQYRLMVEDFADALINNRPPRYAPQDAVANMRALDMLIAAARKNAT